MFGHLPPCPFAQKAIVDGKVEFVELDDVAEFVTIASHVWHFDFDKKDVLCIIAQPDQFTTKETVEIADMLNEIFLFKGKDVVVLEDHPKIKEKVKHVQLNNGKYILFLAQRLSKLNRFAKTLEKGPYYRNWSKSYLRSVKGFRERKTP